MSFLEKGKEKSDLNFFFLLGVLSNIKSGRLFKEGWFRSKTKHFACSDQPRQGWIRGVEKR